ncbi:MAG: hypothetical protein ACF8AM_13125 [Rhodopirellula sp. JB055]|uniref:hypothetical protein n=1 Tax=Rhodopirellula sp. JB055 TaxID=3342846 RepID=UPI00370AB2DC
MTTHRSILFENFWLKLILNLPFVGSNKVFAVAHPVRPNPSIWLPLSVSNLFRLRITLETRIHLVGVSPTIQQGLLERHQTDQKGEHGTHQDPSRPIKISERFPVFDRQSIRLFRGGLSR